MKKRKLLLSLLASVLLYGDPIKDIKDIPQDLTYFAIDLNNTFAKYQNEFVDRYYKPWDSDFQINQFNFDFGEIYFSKKTYYGDNKQEITKQFKEGLFLNTNKENFPSVYQNGITIKNTNCRILPTNKPFFSEFKSNGTGGYPFDYMQNSMLHINTPIKVLHYSKDKAFAFIEAPYVSGWINSDDIAYLEDDKINKIKSMKLVTLKNDDISLIDTNDQFIQKGYIGAIFWKDEDNNIYLTKQNLFHYGVLSKMKIKDEDLRTLPELPTKEHIAQIANQLYGQHYGWGGSGENRDCSMLVRDLFTPFGIFLERNSNQQANEKSDEIIDLSNKTKEEKIRLIKQYAIPFATLFYMKGHIMVYIGTYNDEITIFHTFWSVKTLNKGKHVIGGAYVTSLQPGIELEQYDHGNGTLLDKIISMRVLGIDKHKIKFNKEEKK